MRIVPPLLTCSLFFVYFKILRIWLNTVDKHRKTILIPFLYWKIFNVNFSITRGETFWIYLIWLENNFIGSSDDSLTSYFSKLLNHCSSLSILGMVAVAYSVRLQVGDMCRPLVCLSIKAPFDKREKSWCRFILSFWRYKVELLTFLPCAWEVTYVNWLCYIRRGHG